MNLCFVTGPDNHLSIVGAASKEAAVGLTASFYNKRYNEQFTVEDFSASEVVAHATTGVIALIDESREVTAV